MKIAVVTDSTAYLSEEEVKANNILWCQFP